MCVCVCVTDSWLKLCPEFCRASRPEPHTQCFLWASLTPRWAVSIFLCVCNSCVPVCVSAWPHNLNSSFSFQHRDLSNCREIFLNRLFSKCRHCSTQHVTSRQVDAKEWELLTEAAELFFSFPVNQIIGTWRPWLCHCLEKDSPGIYRHREKKAWWGKYRGVLLSGTVGCQWYSLSHVSQEMYRCYFCVCLCEYTVHLFFYF